MLNAIDHLKASSSCIDALLAIVCDDRVGVSGWHTSVKLEGGARVFDLFDGEDLGRSYRDRYAAKHVSQKAMVHWRKHEATIRRMLPPRLYTEAAYYRALSVARRDACWDKQSGAVVRALEALLELHKSLLRQGHKESYDHPTFGMYGSTDTAQHRAALKETA